MITAAYNTNDLRYIFYYGDNISSNTKAQKKEGRPSLESYLNRIPSYMFMPSYAGIPKPEVFIDKFKRGDKVIYWTYAGLWKNIQDWCVSNNIQLEYKSDIEMFKYTDFTMSLEQFTDYVSSWHMSLQPRDYQIKAAWLILKYRRSMSKLATRAGKTLIAYMVFRYMLEHKAHNILMIVPSVSLVKQAVDDMHEYKEFFQTETVWSAGELCESSNLTVGTFQSLSRRLDRKSKHYDPSFFNKFDVVCCDECHTAKCASIKQLLQHDFMKDVKLVFGFSGTVPDADTIESFTCQSLMGPQIQEIRSHELVDEGFLAQVDMTQVYIRYTDDEALTDKYIRYGEYLNGIDVLDKDRKKMLLPPDERDFTMTHVRKLPFAIQQAKQMYDKREYREYLVDCCRARGSNLLMLEQMLLHHSEERMNVIDGIISQQEGNCVIFAHHTEYINALAAHFRSHFTDKQVCVITGSTSAKRRSEIITLMEHNDNIILCASYACCGTGLTFKNLRYGVMAQSFKAKTINLQSIGRGMLKRDDKDTFYVFDIVDCFPTERLAAQGRVKKKTYIDERYIIHTKVVDV